MSSFLGFVSSLGLHDVTRMKTIGYSGLYMSCNYILHFAPEVVLDVERRDPIKALFTYSQIVPSFARKENDFILFYISLTF